MLTRRVIPCLDVTAGRVVKGVNFVDLRDAGDPVEIARRYDGEGADELSGVRRVAVLERAPGGGGRPLAADAVPEGAGHAAS